MSTTENTSGIPGKPPQYAIQWLSGPLKGQTTGVSSQMTVGRARENTIVLPEDTAGASGKHCAITVSDGKFYVMDLGSTYGTVANGTQMLPPNQAVILNIGDRISLGKDGVTFEVVSEHADAHLPEILPTAAMPPVMDAEPAFADLAVPSGKSLYDGYSIPNIEIPKKKKTKWPIPVIVIAIVLFALYLLGKTAETRLRSKEESSGNKEEVAVAETAEEPVEEEPAAEEPEEEEEGAQEAKPETENEVAPEEEEQSEPEPYGEPEEEENFSAPKAGRTVTSKDENGNTVTETYDENGKLSHKEEPYYKDGKLAGTLCYDAEISCGWSGEQYTTPSRWILWVMKPDKALEKCLSFTLNATITAANMDSALGTQTVYVRTNGAFQKGDYLKIPNLGDTDSTDYSYKIPTKVDGFCMMPYKPTGSFSSTESFWLTNVYYLK